MNGYDIIWYRVRPILEDTTTTATTQTWYDETLMYFLYDGMELLASEVPESLLYDPNALYTLSDPVSMNDTLYFANRYRDALVDYVVSRAFGMDGQDKRDLARSKTHLEQFFAKAGVRNK